MWNTSENDRQSCTVSSHKETRCEAKSINNTMLYTQLVQFESDEFHSAVAKTIPEARELIEAGFEYVCDMEGVKLFRKRK